MSWASSTATSPRGSSRIGASAVAFSPSGTLLASTADGDGMVRLWDPATGQPVRVLHATSPRYGVSGVAFNRNGTVLASADGDGTVRLWNPATGQRVGAPIPADPTPGGAVLAVAFGPSSHLLTSGANDGRVRLWLWQVSAFMNPYGTLCADVGAPTWQEWKQYAAGEPRPHVC